MLPKAPRIYKIHLIIFYKRECPPFINFINRKNGREREGPLKVVGCDGKRNLTPVKLQKKVLLLATIQVSCFHVFAQSLRQIFNWITKVSPQTIQVFWFNVFAQIRRQMMGRLRFEAIKHLPGKINLSAIKFFPFDVSMWTFDQVPRIWE